MYSGHRTVLTLLACVGFAVPASSGGAAAEPGGVLSVALAKKEAASWMRDYTPAQFRRLPVAAQPIEPEEFCEPLLAAAIFQETNQRRADLGLPAFLPDAGAAEAARLHSRWMATTHRLSHDESADQGKPATPFDRLQRQGLRPHLAAENIAYNFRQELAPGQLFYTRPGEGQTIYSSQPDGPALPARSYADFARVIVAQWMHSPPHRAHIVSPELRFLGVGGAIAHRSKRPDTLYATQDFFTPHEVPAPPAATAIRPRAATLIPPDCKKRVGKPESSADCADYRRLADRKVWSQGSARTPSLPRRGRPTRRTCPESSSNRRARQIPAPPFYEPRRESGVSAD